MTAKKYRSAPKTEKKISSVYRVLLKTASHSRLLCIAIILIIAGAIVTALLPPLVLERVIDKLADSHMISPALALLYLALLLLSQLLASARESLLVILGQRITHALRSELCSKLERLSADTLSHLESGSAVSRFVGDVDTVETLFTSGIISMCADAFQLCGIFAVIFTKDRGLAFLLLVILPALFIFTRHVQKRMLSAQVANRLAVARVSNHVPETIRCIRTIHIFHKESWLKQRYSEYLDESYTAMEKNNFYDAVYSPVVKILNAATVSAAMLLSASGNSTIHALFGMSVGASVAVISYISQVFEPLESIGMEIQTIQSAMAGMQRINDFLSLPERLKATSYPNIPKDGIPCVELMDVSFYYDKDNEVLHDLSFSVDTGETVTLTGRTGAGKSTIFKLLLGLYKPQSGHVLINGSEAAMLCDSSKRRLFGCVEQNFRMVPGTVRDQITLFDSSIADEQVKKAAKTVGLDSDIQKLPQGYDTPCSQKLFSQGQWQLLSIARAIAAEPQILLLDEITASLDADTEMTVLAALKRAAKSRTVISISHRLYEQSGTREISIS